MNTEQRVMRKRRGVWDAMLQMCYAHLLRRTCDERGGFTKGRPRQGPVGASEITQTEILRLHNETWEFREGRHAGIMPGKRRQGGQKKQWVDDIVQWGERSLVEMVRQAENRKCYRCLVHEAAYARTSETASWWYYVWCHVMCSISYM